MRIPAALFACLLLGAAPALAQSAPKPAEPAAAPPAAAVSQPAQPAATSPAAKPATPAPAQPAEKQAAAPAPAAEPAKTAETKSAPAAKPSEPAVTKSAAAPAKPAGTAAKPVEQAASPPSASPDSPLKPAVAAATEPSVKPEAKAEAKEAKPESKPDAKPETKAAETKPAAKPETKDADTKPAAKPETKEAMPAAKPEPKKETKTASATCPGHPDALGTERVLTIDPGEFQELGSINYKQTLPLKDHEVVLTFDDGPIPPFTNSVLDTLAANCVKATYFLVGEMAQLRPYLVRRIYNEGHSIGTHSQTHPFAFQRLSMARVEREVDGGITSVDNALGDPRAVSPFFRIPGFGRSKAIDHFLEHKHLITWSADVDTDDWWRGTTPNALIARTMKRLNAKGRGIVLMHDIHPSTALALPRLLKELKKEGYRVVHVVAAGKRPKELPQVVATKTEMESWPSVLHAKAQKTGAAMSALRHRVKNALARRHHRHRHHRRAHVKRPARPAVTASNTPVRRPFAPR